jgi:hypothetical protein
MNPTTVYDLGRARLAEMHRQARRDARASAARQDRPGRRPADLAAGQSPSRVRWAHRLGRVSAS